MARTSAQDEDFRDTIPFTMHRVTALTVANATDEFDRCGVNVQGARVLIVLLQHPGSRVGEIAEVTCIEFSTLSHMLRRFERDGLIARKRSPEDNRTVLVSLTARGKRTATRVHEIARSHQRIMLDGLSPAEIATLRRVLTRMRSNVEAI